MEYDIATSLLDKWLKQFQNSDSFHEKDNRSPEQQELLELRKRNRQLEMENDILKQATLTKERKFLDERQDNLAAEIREIFRQSRYNYGTRKIKAELCKKRQTISRRRIGRIMKQEGLISTYTIAQYRPHVDKCNESKVQNIVNRDFSDQPQYNVAVSDLTYVRVEANWNYICVLVDLFNREITGDSAGKNKDAGFIFISFCKREKRVLHFLALFIALH